MIFNQIKYTYFKSQLLMKSLKALTSNVFEIEGIIMFNKQQIKQMSCKYAYLLPIWIAFIVHQIIFSPQFESFRQLLQKIWVILMKSLRFRKTDIVVEQNNPQRPNDQNKWKVNTIFNETKQQRLKPVQPISVI